MRRIAKRYFVITSWNHDGLTEVFSAKLSEQTHYRMRLDKIGWAGDGRRFLQFADIVRRHHGGVNPPAPASAFLTRRKLERERLQVGIDHDVKHPAHRPPAPQSEAVRFV